MNEMADIREFPSGKEDYWLWVCSMQGIYWKQQMVLLHYFGDIEQAFLAPESEFETWKKLNVSWIDKFLDCRTQSFFMYVQKQLLEKQVHFISREHPSYPGRLLQIPDLPGGIFYRGSLPDEGKVCAAVIGARACSEYGRQSAEEIGRILASCDVQVISGMASGIDGISQQAALDEGGRSFGVLGCGADICYPRDNISLYCALIEKGGILSEFPCGTNPLRHHFPMRNRLISALADCVIVVEAREKSGSLITVDFALQQGKDVYAMPGRSCDPLSRGCNSLISQGAAIIPSPDALPSMMGIAGQQKKNGISRIQLSDEEKKILSLLGSDPVSFERLQNGSGLQPGKLNRLLLDLQMKRAVRETARNLYVAAIRGE